MLCVAGVDSKSYSSVFVRGGKLGVALACPQPGCAGEVLRGHGWHRRYLASVLTFLRRVRCLVCGVTHVILPEDVCAWLDLSLVTLELVITESGGPASAARAAGLSGVEGVRRVRRWRRRLAQGLVSKVVALLPAGDGPWWERAAATIGAGPRLLVRLRWWLWSKYRLLLTGLAGLLCGGRPCWHVRGRSTELGNYPSG